MIKLLIFLGLLLLIESIIVITVALISLLKSWMFDRDTKDDSANVIYMNFKERRRM